MQPRDQIDPFEARRKGIDDRHNHHESVSVTASEGSAQSGQSRLGRLTRYKASLAPSSTAWRSVRVAAIAVAAYLPVSAAAQNVSTLIVSATGFQHGRGHAIAKLFQPGDNVLGHARTELSGDIREGRASLEFKDLPAGSYAIVVFHDENDNREIDHNMIRLPSEPLGFSGGFRLGVFSGLPRFDKLRFEHAAGPQTIEVRVK